MAFSLYGYLDQRWIDTKLEEFNIYSGDIIGLVRDMGFEATSILESPNPIIYGILEYITNDFCEHKLVEELSDSLRDAIREGIYETYFINALDSHMAPYEVIDDLKERILEEYTELYPELNNSEIEERFQTLSDICDKYSF